LFGLMVQIGAVPGSSGWHRFSLLRVCRYMSYWTHRSSKYITNFCKDTLMCFKAYFQSQAITQPSHAEHCAKQLDT
jgi:hypothetical protein